MPTLPDRSAPHTEGRGFGYVLPVPSARKLLLTCLGLSVTSCEAGSGGGAETSAPSPVCLPIEELLAPGVDSMCVESEATTGHLWLEVPLAMEGSEPCGVAFEMDATCRVEDINSASDKTTIALQCEDEFLIDVSATLHISTPELHFPLCNGDALSIRYESSEVCGTGGLRRALTIRRADEETLLAASFDGSPKAWFSPFDVSFEDAECGMKTIGGCSYWRETMRVAFGDAPPVLVYDGTLRTLPTPVGYVATSRADRFDEACCADCSLLPRGVLVFRGSD